MLASESTVLCRSPKGFYGSCREKMPDRWLTHDWLLHHDNMPCHMDSWLFLVPNQKKMVVVPGLFTSPYFMAYSGSQVLKHGPRDEDLRMS